MFCAGSICQTATLYIEGAGKQRIQKRFDEQIQIFLKNDMDLLIAEVNKINALKVNIHLLCDLFGPHAAISFVVRDCHAALPLRSKRTRYATSLNASPF